MGLLDHRRQWQYVVNASPSQCIDAFESAFTGSGGLVARARWAVRRTRGGAVAVYGGRKGLGAMGGIVSKTAAHEQNTALGSEVTFETRPGGPDRTICDMWLSSSGRAGIAGLFGATADARFIRPYMQAVQRHILALDPAADVSTS